MPKEPTAILLLSGGIDSTVALALYRSWGWPVVALSFDYGQSLVGELDYAAANAAVYQAEHVVVTLDTTPFAKGCALLDATPMAYDRTVDQIHDAGTPPTYVPFRNGIFLAYAVAMGEARGIDHIVCGGNGLYSGHYPDDTTRFGSKFEAAAREGTSPTYHPTISFPHGSVCKTHVVGLGVELGVDFRRTLSCYQPRVVPLGQAAPYGWVHCGRCDSCEQRRHAFNPYFLSLEGHLPTVTMEVVDGP